MYSWRNPKNGRRAHYLAMPRTGSKAVRDAWLAAGGKLLGSHHDMQWYDAVVCRDDLVFTVVRNHWDWFVSFWYLNGCPGKFPHFVEETIHSSEWIQRTPDVSRCELYWQFAPKANRVLRYESFTYHMNDYLHHHGFPVLNFKQSGEKKPRPYQTYYRPATKNLIFELFNAEITLYRFHF